MKINVALLQFASYYSNIKLNRDKAEEMIRTAMQAETKPDLVMLPELWSNTFSPDVDRKIQSEQYSETVDGENITLMRSLAKEYGVWIAAGSITLKEADGTKYNAMFLIDRNGEIVANYNKVHLCRWVNEDRAYGYGEGPVTVETELGKLGLIVCYDVRFPELIRIEAKAGAQILLVPSRFTTNIYHWKQLVTTRAIENQIFVLGCGSCEGPECLGKGHSLIVDPLGTVLAEAGDGEEILCATIDLDDVEKTRATVKYLEDLRPEVYEKYGLVK